MQATFSVVLRGPGSNDAAVFRLGDRAACREDGQWSSDQGRLALIGRQQEKMRHRRGNVKDDS